MRRPNSYGTNNQRFRIYRNKQLPFRDRAIIPVPLSLGDDPPASTSFLTRYCFPAALGALIGGFAGLGYAKGAALGAIAGAVVPDFGVGLRSEMSRIG